MISSKSQPYKVTTLRAWKLIIGGVLSLLVLLWGVGEFMLKTSLRPVPSSYRETQAALDTMLRLYPHIRPWVDSLQAHHALRDTVVLALDGTQLHGYYLPAAKPTQRVALLVHGYQDAALRMLHIAYLYHHDLGANVVMPAIMARLLEKALVWGGTTDWMCDNGLGRCQKSLVMV